MYYPVLIPFFSLLTRIRDYQGRHWCSRSFASDKMITKHGPEFAEDARWLVQKVQAAETGFSTAAREANHRGPHWSSNFGHDRNYKSVCGVSMHFGPSNVLSTAGALPHQMACR